MSNIVVFVLGTIIGSFLNVCIYRIPRGESVVFPGSRCPSCKASLAAWDLVPVLSFLVLRGRCRHCNANIPRLYPIVEALTGIIFVLIFLAYGISPAAGSKVILVSFVLTCGFIDLAHGIIPNKITLPGLVIGLLLNPVLLPSSISAVAFGSLIGAGLVFTVSLLSKGGMGMGDVKLMAMVGSFVGWRGSVMVFFISCILGGIVGVFLLITRRAKGKDPIPFGPFLAIGTIIIAIWGPWVRELVWYWD